MALRPRPISLPEASGAVPETLSNTQTLTGLARYTRLFGRVGVCQLRNAAEAASTLIAVNYFARSTSAVINLE
jgi:hypothetical protein